MNKNNERIISRFRELLDEYPINYFQKLDSESKFPVKFFNDLKEKQLLSIKVNDNNSYHVFSEIASMIGEKSIGSSLCWVMHNQQYNMIIMYDPDFFKDKEQVLLSSMTSSYGGKWIGNNDKIINKGGNNILIREAPIVSYGEHSDSIVFTSHKKNDDCEVFLAYTNIENCIFTEPEFKLTSVTATASKPCKIDCDLNKITFIGPFNKHFKNTFVPIAHIGWMSAYNGGVKGMMKRLRGEIRSGVNNHLHSRLKSSTLSKHRYAKVFTVTETNGLLIEATINNFLAGNNVKNHILNSVKIKVSESFSDIIGILEQELGYSYALKKNDALGLEMLSRDLKAASLMYNNDALYDINFKHWYVGL
ncbi:hypothetical protein AB6D60_22385 [Vibrio splendidus]